MATKKEPGTKKGAKKSAKKRAKKKAGESVDEIITSINDAVDVRADLDDMKAVRFYDRLRSMISDFVDRRGNKLGKAKELLLLVPDVFILLFRLFRDDRVSSQNKTLLGTGLAYFVFPLDVMPEAILGPMGFLDDLVLAAYILNKMLLDTDEQILREHWSGKQDVLTMIRKILRIGEDLVSKKFVERVKKMVG